MAQVLVLVLSLALSLVQVELVLVQIEVALALRNLAGQKGEPATLCPASWRCLFLISSYITRRDPLPGQMPLPFLVLSFCHFVILVDHGHLVEEHYIHLDGAFKGRIEICNY